MTRDGSRSGRARARDALRARGRRRALLRDRRAHVRGRAARRDRALRGLVPNVAIAINRGSAAEMFVAQPGQQRPSCTWTSVTLGQRFARFATDVVVRRPALWRLFRGRCAAQFDRACAELGVDPQAGLLAPLEAALDALRRRRRSACSTSGRAPAQRHVSSPRATRRPTSSASTVSERMLDEARRLTDSHARHVPRPRTPSGCRSTRRRSTSSRSAT